jgi:tetratricopeptide (TPR) repeat protein
MFKKIIIPVLFVLISFGARAQSADAVYNQYLDFNLARFQGEEDKLMELGEKLIPVADKLPEKAKVNFYFSMGKIYEDGNQHKKAIPFYEKVAVAVPDYYVAHRALGYLYLEDVKAIEKQLSPANDEVTHKKLMEQYKAAVLKTLPHLEKAQACDPSDETLAVIKTLYRNIKDTKGLNTLDTRLKEQSKTCIDILSDH